MIRVKGLVKNFGKTADQITAVKHIDLDVSEAEFCVLLGPSGCGKTTTLRCIAGLERPDGGEIRINNTIVAHPESGTFIPPERREVSMVFQSYAIWPHMSVFENVAFPLSWGRKKAARAEVKKSAEEALARVKLDKLQTRAATDLSGGQQQRVALARALALGTKVILMDEPLSNLDARLRDEMRIELKKLTAELGVTTLYVTHDQIEALALADKVCVMNAGSILQVGKPEDIYKQPKTRFVSEFLGQMNFICGRAVGPGQVETPLGKLSLATPTTVASGAEVTLGIRPEAITLKKISTNVSPAEALLEGEITIRSFLGNSVVYEVSLRETTLRVQTGDNSFSLREKVSVHLPADAWRVFAESDPG
jgi:iron(III) transport system ATP-binding protein